MGTSSESLVARPGRASAAVRRQKYETPEFGELRARLATNIRAARRRKGWTVAETAARCGLDIRFYQKIERGTLNTTFVTLARLGRGFGIDVAQLIREPDATDQALAQAQYVRPVRNP